VAMSLSHRSVPPRSVLFFSTLSAENFKRLCRDDAIDNENENGARFQTSTYRRIIDQDCTKQMDIDCDKDQHYNSRCNY
ncbi:hypothetical protein ISN44_As11g015660, partial [Arabidopsis suecica]